MAGLSITERVRLSLLLGRRGLRHLAGRVRGHPLIRWNFMPGKTDRLVIAPQDLRTADGTRASEIYAGRFVFAGKVVHGDIQLKQLTPLMSAVPFGSPEMVKALLDAGADVNAKDSSGQTPFTIASQIFPDTLLDDNLRPEFVHKSTVEILVKHGAKPYVPGSK